MAASAVSMKPIESWSVDETCAFVRSLNPPHYDKLVAAMQDDGTTGEMLALDGIKLLAASVGLADMHVNRITRDVATLRAKQSAANQPSTTLVSSTSQTGSAAATTVINAGGVGVGAFVQTGPSSPEFQSDAHKATEAKAEALAKAKLSPVMQTAPPPGVIFNAEVVGAAPLIVGVRASGMTRR